MRNTHYGIHFTCLLKAIGKREWLANIESVKQFLLEIVDAAEMRVLAGPLVGREEGDPAHEGVSGVVILYESHAAIHTYPRIGAAFIDVFSCKPLSEDMLYPVFNRYMGNYEVAEKYLADRGEHWSFDIADEMAKWSGARPRI